MSADEARRHQQTDKLLRTAKLSSCSMVAGAVLISTALLPQQRYGIVGDLLVIAVWIANYVTLTGTLASSQRLVMMERIMDERDNEALIMFSKVSLRMHFFALLLWLNPARLYKRHWWDGQY